MKKKLVHAVLGFFLLTGFTTPGFAQWEKTNWPATSNYFDFYNNQDRVVSRTWDTLNGGRTFLSTDNGVNWAQIAADSSLDISSMVILNNEILAGTWNGFISTPVGSTSWTALAPTGIPADTAVCALAMINTSLYAGAIGTIYMSSDNGNSWVEVKAGIPAGARITSFAVIGDAVFAGSDANGVFVTPDAGTNWTAINTGLTDLHISQLVTMGNILYAVTLKSAFTSSDNGTSWTDINIPHINCIVVADNKLFAGTDNEGMYVSSDSGAGWDMVDITGMPANTRIWSMVASNDNLIAGTSDGVWHAPLSSIITPVETDNAPALFVLERNFPNPFNPTTSIGFSIPVSGNVTLAIYNITGQKVRTLVDTPMSSGAHKIVWDGLTDTGMHAPSGVYLYELRVGTFRDAKKLLLMK